MLKFILFFLFAFTFFERFTSAHESLSLVVNIISHSLKNGAGKEADVAILKEELEQVGHHVNLLDYYEVNHIPSADINIFLAQFKTIWFSKAKLNWFIPNAESCDATLDELQAFDLILCKTKECLRIYSAICQNTYYLGFTSRDRYQPSHKDFLKVLHVAGKSRMKGTEKVLSAWRKYPQLPNLVLIQHREMPRSFYPPKHVQLINRRVSDRSLIKMQNTCGIHLCPSKTEGFGHYIMEAMSAGAVIVTTDAPPMNEFIWDEKCLVKYNQTSRKNYATMYLVDSDDLAQTVKKIQHLSYEELKKIGQHNRQEYLRRREEFKQNFKELMHLTMTKF